MKVDKWFFDRKGRYYTFYLKIERWVFHIALEMGYWTCEFVIGASKKSIELYEATKKAVLETQDGRWVVTVEG